MLRCTGVVVILLLSFLHSGLADEKIGKAPADAWIYLTKLPVADPSRDGRIKNGISNLLSEDQIKYKPGGYLNYDRFAYRIVDRTGLESGAAVEWTFDPSRSKVTLNRLQVVRDGKVLDRMADAKVDTFRREPDAERGIFDGRFTARVNVADVRVGDIVDYAMTYDVTPLVGRDLYASRFNVSWDEPIALIRRKMIWPTAQPLEIKLSDTDLQPSKTADGQNTTYLWEIVNPAPYEPEEYVPADMPGRASVEVSNVPNWQAVVDALLPYYEPAADFPVQFAERIENIATMYDTPEERMIASLRPVQDEVRYVSLATGAGSHIPRRPETVIETGFGDCKDKSLLLVSVLKRLGIKATSALTDTEDGPALMRRVPRLGAFNHVVVKAEIGKRIYWLDATDYLQGGTADTLDQLDYGFALPLVPQGADLERIPRSVPFSPTITVAEHFVFPEKSGEPLRLNVTTTYLVGDADYMRKRLGSESIEAIGRTYLEYYNKQYPGITSAGTLVPEDDRDANVVTVSERYELSHKALVDSGLSKDFPLRADIAVSNLPTPTTVGRRSPIGLGKPFNRAHKIKVDNLKARFIGPERSVDRKTPYVWFQTYWTSTDDEFVLEWHLSSVSGKVPASAAPDYLKSVDDIDRNIEYRYNFSYSESEELDQVDTIIDYLSLVGRVIPAWGELNSFVDGAVQDENLKETIKKYSFR